MNRNLLSVLVVLLLIVSAFGLFKAFSGPIEHYCYPKFDAAKFIATEYPHFKELGVDFLTLLITVFGATITFSERIVGANTKSKMATTLLVVTWMLLFLSILAAGTGLAYFTMTLNQVLYKEPYSTCDFYERSYGSAGLCYVISGCLFVGSLLSLMGAGIISFTQRANSNSISKEMD